jgi:hypothetical protein
VGVVLLWWSRGNEIFGIFLYSSIVTNNMNHLLTFAQILFKNKALSSDGQAYEDLFIRIMEETSTSFQPVKPQGPLGDKKNDGFDFVTGEYYQCYAPEDLSKNIPTAVNKLQKSADGLVGYWDGISKVKKIYFVVNDEYDGAYPEIYQKLAELRNQYVGIKFELFRTKDLERKILSLDIDAIQRIIGFLPDPQTTQLDPDYLTEVLRHLMNFESNFSENNLPDQLDFKKKIKHNELSEYIGNHLQFAYNSIYQVDNYFKYNSDFEKDELQRKFITLYQQEVESIGLIGDKSNIIFINLLSKICPRDNQSIRMAALILMAYYFQACDIFEEPI